MKRFLSAFLAVMTAAFAVFPVAVSAAPAEPAVRSGFAFDGEGVTDAAPLDRVFYLPAGVDVRAVRFDTDEKSFRYYGSETDVPFPDDRVIDLTPGETTDGYGNVCYSITLSDGGSFLFYSAGRVASVFVATSRGKDYIVRNKNNRDKESRIIITDEEGAEVYNDVSGDTLSEIKGRGNASFANEKKPFQIKLGKKTDLFGMGKSKTWILLANYNDSSYMRNTCAFTIADALELPFTPKSVFVNLYIDNEYQGIYQLCEKTQIGTNRIEITDLEDKNQDANGDTDLDKLQITNGQVGESDSDNLAWFRHARNMKDPDDITGGYLVELDNLYSGAEKCVFRTENGNEYTVKSPEVASLGEMRYIANLFSRFEQALYDPSGCDSDGVYYTEYCDLESLVKVYIVEEITKNWDAYIGSVFFRKDVDRDGEATKIYAGPVWDFDNTWGNLRRGTFNTDRTEIWADGDNNYGGSKYKADFGAALMQHEDARQLAAELYSKAAFCCEEMLAEGGLIDRLSSRISASAAMDMSRWRVEKRNQAFIYFTSYDNGGEDSAVGYLRGFMSERTEALYAAFGAEHKEHTDPDVNTGTETGDETASEPGQSETGDETDPASEETAPPATEADTGNVGSTERADAVKRYIKYIVIGVAVLSVAVLAAVLLKKKK